MIGFKHARLVNSNLDLNGPELSFTTQPVSATTTQADGTMSFTGAATASFPAGQTERATNTGSIAYQWYKNGAALSDGTNVTGSTTSSLSLSGLNYGDNDAKVYLAADYVNSAYGSGLTPNAISEPKNSNEATILIQPLASITQQPQGSTVSENIATTFSVIVFSENGINDSFSFEWFIDGISINTLDYLSSVSRSVSNTKVFTVNNLANSPNFDLRVPGIESTLTVTSTAAALRSVKVVVTHPDTNPSSITSDEVNYDIASARKIVQFERYDGALSTIADSGQRDIVAFGALSFRANANSQSRAIAIWAPEEDVDVKITMGGGAGADRSGNKGGEGGVSVFKVTLKKNEEYQIKLGVNDTQGGGPRGGTNGGGGSAIIYNQARVIAVCGGGGGAGTNAGGGDGGGVQVAGENGDGTAGGPGGRTYSQGSLPSEGSFPTNTTGSQLSGCTIGQYWRDQGFSPCVSMGLQKFRYADGRVFEDSAEIVRGYKSGTGHRNNGGNATGNQGGGGAGAMGGNGAVRNNSGGGGGSGYGSGDIELLTGFALQTGTQLGGNDGVGFICIEEVEQSSFSNPDPNAPCIPPKGNETTFKTVTFTITRTTSENVSAQFTKTSGIGPDKLIFGPNSGSFTTQIDKDSEYTISAESNVDTRSLNQQDNTLTLSDTDSNPGQINITSDIGQFTTSTTIDQDCRWVANW